MLSKFNTKNFQELPWQKIIYLAITFIFVITVAVLFVESLLFLSGNINKAFLERPAAEKNNLTLDIANYELISRRFNWPIPQETISTSSAGTLIESVSNAETSTTSESNVATTTESLSTTPAATSTATTIDNSSQPTINKASLVITVLNSTTVSGSASRLQSNLTKAGFSVKKIGDQSPTQDTTTIQVKQSIKQNQAVIDEITQIVAKKYSPQPGTELLENDVNDVVIIIGRK